MYRPLLPFVFALFLLINSCSSEDFNTNLNFWELSNEEEKLFFGGDWVYYHTNNYGGNSYYRRDLTLRQPNGSYIGFIRTSAPEHKKFYIFHFFKIPKEASYYELYNITVIMPDKNGIMKRNGGDIHPPKIINFENNDEIGTLIKIIDAQNK